MAVRERCVKFFNSDRLYIDHKVLAARGWTRGLIERFLVKFDRLGSVSHWKNYYGKSMYLTERVVAAECLPQFQAAFAASLKRRKLGPEVVEAFAAERRRGNEEYRVALQDMSEADLGLLTVAQNVADIFDEARTRGYRTPHK